jgi:hypothetical protein
MNLFATENVEKSVDEMPDAWRSSESQLLDDALKYLGSVCELRVEEAFPFCL